MDKKMPWYTVLLANSGGFSSKRVCGLLGWFICLIIFICAFIFDKAMPTFADVLISVSAALLGVDSITKIFDKN